MPQFHDLRPTPIPEKINAYLRDKRVTRAELAMNLGIPCATLQDMLCGKREISVHEYIAICRALGVGLNIFGTHTKRNENGIPAV